MFARRWLTRLFVVCIGVLLAGCASSSSDSGSNDPRPIDPAFAREAGAGIQNVLAEVGRIARGAVLLEGRVRPSAYPSRQLKPESSLMAPGDPCPIILFEATDEGFTLTVDYGPAPGCVDAFDGVTRSGTVTVAVTGLVFDASHYAPIAGRATLTLTAFRIGEVELSGKGTVDIVSLTLESWNLDLTSRGPAGSQHLKFQGIVTADYFRDAETINGTGVLTGDAGTMQIKASMLRFDFDSAETSLVCDDAIGGDLTLTGSTVVTLHFGYPAPGCGFADLTIGQKAPTRVSINEQPHPANTVALVVGVESAPVPAFVGEDLTFTVTVFNGGSDATGVVLSNALPPSIRLVSAGTSQGTCAGTLTVTCNLGDLPRLARAVVTMVGVPTESGWFEHISGVTSNETEADTADNTFVARGLVVGSGSDPGPTGVDLVLGISADPSPAMVGQPVTYTLTVSNQGDQTATGVVLVDSVAYYTEWVSSATTQGTCEGNAPVTCSLGTLGPGAQAVVTIVVTVPSYGGSLSNHASVSSIAADDVPLNNTVTLNVNVLSQSQTPSRIEISPGSAVGLGTGSTKQFSALVYYDGTTYPQYGGVTWSSSNEAVVAINSSGLARALTVGAASVTASIGGVTSQAVRLTVEEVRTIDLPTNDVVYDANTQRLYVSVPSRGGTRGNTVTAIDPATGTVVWSEFVGSEPGKLALSGDGRWLYVALEGATGVQRFDIPSRTLDILVSLGSDQFGAAYRVMDMQVLPGQAGSLAVVRNSGGVAVYDDGVQRPGTTPSYSSVNRIAFSSLASTLYAFGSYTLQTLAVDASGVSVSTTANNVVSAYDGDMRHAGGRLYFSTGQVVDPASATLIGTFVLSDSGYYSYSASVEPDAASGRTYFLLDGGSARVIHAFDQQTFRPTGALEIQTGTQSPPARPLSSLRRWGTNGLAFRTNSDQVVLVRTALVP